MIKCVVYNSEADFSEANNAITAEVLKAGIECEKYCEPIIQEDKYVLIIEERYRNYIPDNILINEVEYVPLVEEENETIIIEL
jgi:hypothetical protein